MSNFNNKFKSLLEGYGSITFKKRLFYPRNLQLSNEFIKAFKLEFNRLLGEGHGPKIILDKISKALHFHSKNN